MLEGGYRPEDHPTEALASKLEDAKEDGLYEKWKIDGPNLVAKIAAMSAAEVGAVYYASATFWDMDDRFTTDERVDAVIDRYNSENDPNYSATFHPMSNRPAITHADNEVMDAETRLREMYSYSIDRKRC
jgi:hypothetical protein